MSNLMIICPRCERDIPTTQSRVDNDPYFICPYCLCINFGGKGENGCLVGDPTYECEECGFLLDGRNLPPGRSITCPDCGEFTLSLEETVPAFLSEKMIKIIARLGGAYP